MMTELLSACRWPPLSPPYQLALSEAVGFILARFEVRGILVSGSIIRGNPHPSSDFDIVVAHAQPQRQRLQRFFGGVPTEIFVNPPQAIESYLRSEQKQGRPCTAHMLVTGFVILERDSILAELRQQAHEFLARPPDLSEVDLTARRYGAADLFENALDIAATDPVGASLLLGQVIPAMLDYAFLKANRYQPRHKELLQAVEELDPGLAVDLRAFYSAADFETRLAAAARIADRTIAARGFFEWESPLEPFE